MPSPKVLLVDDDDMEITLLQAQLERLGYEVVAVRSVVEAFRQILAQHFDFLVTDLHMPQPGDGFAVVTAMRHCQPEASTVIISGSPDVEESLLAIHRQADDICTKPFDVKKLLDLRRKKAQRLHRELRPLKPLAMPNSVATASAGGEKHSTAEEASVAIPMLRAVAGSHGLQGDRRHDLEAIPATRVLAAPGYWCPNPQYTSLLRVRGKSMEPLIRDWDIVAVDSLQTETSRLDGKIVVATNDEKGLCVSRFRRQESIELLESESPGYETIVLGGESGWRILGRVLWWISTAP